MIFRRTMNYPKINKIVMRKGFWLTIEALDIDVYEPYSIFLQKINKDSGNYNLFLREVRPFLLKMKLIRIWRSKLLGYKYIELTESGRILKHKINELRGLLNDEDK